MIQFHTGIFNQKKDLETFKSNAWEFACFDEDANGNNGTDYLLPQAKVAGFETNIEYWAVQAFQDSDTTEQAIETFVDLLGNSWNNYCQDWNYDIETLPNGDFYVVFASYDN